MCMLALTTTTHAARIKDLTRIAGVRDNQLVGYGLVVGLDGTGDRTSQAPFTQQTFRNMLVQFGIKIPSNVNFELKNVAAVAVSAKLPPFAKVGQTIDINVSSIGNATSLRGGELLMAPLKGADSQTYAVAQGSVIVSGFGIQGSDGSKVSVNTTSSGRIPNGATIENVIPPPFVQDGFVTFHLNEPDFTTAERIAKIINKKFHHPIAKSIDASAITVDLNQLVSNSKQSSRIYKDDEDDVSTETNQTDFSSYIHPISAIENLTLTPAMSKAKIIVNSRTGTIVIDENVVISPVAVSHGSLSVVISEHQSVSQPAVLSGGTTVSQSASDISVNQSQNRAFVLKTGTSLKELVDEINRVGAAPGDIISILEAIKAAGALHAELEVI